MRAEDGKIVQIMPATGVKATYKQDDGRTIEDKVNVFALTESGMIFPIVLDSDGLFHDATDAENFSGLIFD